MAPKDKDPMLKKSGVIYSYKCGTVECDEEYIGVLKDIWWEVQGTPESPLPHIWPF